MVSPRKNISQALFGVTSRGRKYVPPQSGCRPTFANDWLKVAVVATMRRSQASARLQPAPKAGPLTDAITGFVIWRIAVTTRRAEPSKRENSSASWRSIRSAIAATSPPAQKARPAPVITTTRTFRSAPAASSASARSRRMCPASEFNFSGRLSVIVVMPESSVTSICSYIKDVNRK